MYPLVSVIVITYSNYSFAQKTLGSILSQSYPRMELLVQDDGSEGFAEYAGTLEAWIRENSASNLERFAVRGLPQNVGTVENLNRALEWTTGDYIKVLSPGDGFTGRDSLANYVSCLEHGKAELALCPVVCVTSAGRTLYPSPGRWAFLRSLTPVQMACQLYSGNPLNIVGAFYKSALLKEMGGYDTRYRLLEDYPFWLRFFREQHPVVWLGGPLCYYEADTGISRQKRNIHDAYLQDFGQLESDIARWDHRYGALQPFYNRLRYACRYGDMVKYNNAVHRGKIYREWLWIVHRARQVIRRLFFNPIPKMRRMPK